jgi:hypothetical protein
MLTGWPSSPRKPAPPPALPDDLTREVVLTLLFEFGSAGVALAVVLGLIALAGCAPPDFAHGVGNVRPAATPPVVVPPPPPPPPQALASPEP